MEHSSIFPFFCIMYYSSIILKISGCDLLHQRWNILSSQRSGHVLQVVRSCGRRWDARAVSSSRWSHAGTAITGGVGRHGGRNLLNQLGYVSPGQWSRRIIGRIVLPVRRSCPSCSPLAGHGLSPSLVRDAASLTSRCLFLCFGHSSCQNVTDSYSPIG